MQGTQMQGAAPGGELSPQQIAEQVRALGKWFHNLDLKGVRTAPDHFLGDFPSNFFRHFSHALPADLTGKSVLDIGCNGGFYLMEMHRRGAARLVGIDMDARYLEQARFATRVAGVKAELRQLSVYDVAALGEKFDVVLFMGVLYHLRHPLLALDLLHEYVVRDTLVFQTMQRGSDRVVEVEEDYAFEERAHFDDPRYPSLHFIEHRYAGDPTNWWAANRGGTEALLRASGFAIQQHVANEVYVCKRVQRPEFAGAPTHPARPEERARD